MSQFDFGVIDPYVVDGVQLADDLNQFRDALLSYHRGGTRPPYVVAGMLWINDAGGPTNWILNVYLSPTIGDRPLFTYDTTTGNITVSAGATGTVSAAALLAQAAASPSVQWNATNNPIDLKAWRMTVNAAGALVLASYNDAGVQQQSITFNRDGTITTPSAPNWRRLGRVVPTAGLPTVDFTGLPSDINDLQCTFDLVPVTNDSNLGLQFYNSGGSLVATNYSWSLNMTQDVNALNSAALNSSAAATALTTMFLLNFTVAGNRVANLATNPGAGIRGDFTIPNIRDAARSKSANFRSVYINGANTAQNGITGNGQMNAPVTALTGLRFQFVGTTFAAGGAVTLWGSP